MGSSDKTRHLFWRIEYAVEGIANSGGYCGGGWHFANHGRAVGPRVDTIFRYV
jgi:hypothetical protein